MKLRLLSMGSLVVTTLDLGFMTVFIYDANRIGKSQVHCPGLSQSCGSYEDRRRGKGFVISLKYVKSLKA